MKIFVDYSDPNSDWLKFVSFGDYLNHQMFLFFVNNVPQVGTIGLDEF